MYQIDKNKNRIKEISKKTFSELGFRERENLQEWIAYNPNVFGEELLIIQKEFANFDETNERLDLLAIDKNGNLVIIENKLDDSGKDVTWQSLKYTSYCSGLTKENITKIYQEYLDKYFKDENAEDNLSDFFNGQDYEEIVLNNGFNQRIILVASNFRKEVTSTILWLMNYKLKIQCFKTTAYQFGEQLFINFEQIIPTKDAEDYMIGMAEKAQNDIQTQTKLQNRHIIRMNFWKVLLEKMNIASNLFQNISPSKNNWIGSGSGVRGVPYNFVVSGQYARVELYIDRGNKEENKQVFDYLFGKKNEIEKQFEDVLIWERLDDKRASRIKYETQGNIFDKEKWTSMVDFMANAMIKFENTLKNYMSQVNFELKHT
jgi:hypothetical protein